MADFERIEDFDDGSVYAASFDLRPDAIVSLVGKAPGPVAIGDVSGGHAARGWYVRPDVESGMVVIAVAEDSETWGAETDLFEIPAGTTIEKVGLAFDANGRPVVAMGISGGVYVYRWDEDAGDYAIGSVEGNGASPAVVARAAGSPLASVLLFYQRGSSILYRGQEDDFATEYDTGLTLASNEQLWAGIAGSGGRLHLAYSIYDETAGEYALDWVSEEAVYAPSCLDTANEDDVVGQGAESIVVWRADGSLTTRCTIECDVLIVGAGGDSGDSGRGEDSVFWADPSTGEALDPDVDAIPSAHRAYGGGHGASNDFDADGSGGSGGGGGGASPSNNSMWTQGGSPLDDAQGNPGGGGQSTWGLLDPKRATSGGGGGYGGPGTGGTTLQGSPHQKGLGGGGGTIPVFNSSGPEGGDGSQTKTTSPSTGSVPGGGGAGGVVVVEGLVIPQGETIPIRVGQGVLQAEFGNGGSQGGTGITGLIAVRVTRVILDGEDPAEVSGGTGSVLNDYRYIVFTADGTVTVTTPGVAEALLVGGGGGGGSDAGGGGGGGEVQVVDLLLSEDVAVSIGEGGAGGISGGVGEDGEPSSIGGLAEARGGGGGAGNGSAAGSGATGGGGHGEGGDGGAGAALRGFSGGDGGGYDLGGGGSERHAGGGGGAGGGGELGATEEVTGDPLDDNWGTPSPAGSLDVSGNFYQLDVTGGQKRGLLSTIVSRGEMFVQGRVRCGISPTDVGIRVRGQYSTDEDGDVEGFRPHINESRNDFHEVAYVFDLNTWHVMQGFAEDGSQEYAVRGPNGSPREVSVVRDTQSSTALDGTTNRTFGFYCEGAPTAGPSSRIGDCSHLAAFRTKWLLVGNAPSGGSAEVESEDGEVVATGSESGGEILVDLSMFGDGSDGTEEPVPLPGGWPICRVRDSGGVVVAEAFGSFFPGGEFDVDGSTLTIREDATGAEPVPVTGLLHYENFEGSSPGPEHGDGGAGLDVDADYRTLLGVERLGGGGGGGSTAVLAGAGQDSDEGGGGDGAYDSNAPGDGDANTGGGGGGSGDTSVEGGDGGSGIVCVRTARFDFDEIAEAQRFSTSAFDQTLDNGVFIDGRDEIVSFGDVRDMDGATAFTLVIRYRPDETDTQRNVLGRYRPTSNRQYSLFQRDNGLQVAFALSQTGSDVAILWTSTGFSTGQDRMFAFAFDGSEGGTNGIDRLRQLRLEDALDSWTDTPWDFQFFSGRSDVPTEVVTIAGVEEMLGHRDGGGSDPAIGDVRFLAYKYGVRYTEAELDAMDLWDHDNVDPADWDRLYRFDGHVGDEAGSVDGDFTDPP